MSGIIVSQTVVTTTVRITMHVVTPVYARMIRVFDRYYLNVSGNFLGCPTTIKNITITDKRKPQ